MPLSIPSATSARLQPAPRWVPVTLAAAGSLEGLDGRGLGGEPCGLWRLPPLPLTWLRPQEPGMLAQARGLAGPSSLLSLPPAVVRWREARLALSHRHSGSPTGTRLRHGQVVPG